MSEPAFSWKSVIFESLFVVLGVVLAFLANEYRQQKQDENRAVMAIQSIVLEVETNKNSILDALNYHTSLIDTLSSFVRENEGKRIPDIKIFNKGFIAPAELLENAYNTAIATDVLNNHKYDVVLQIGNLYARQESYNLQKERAGSIIYNAIYENGSEGILKNYANLLSIIYTFIYKENELLNTYNIALKELGEYKESD